MNKQKYRRAFIAQNTGHDFAALKSIANELVFLTTGYEDEDSLPFIVERGLSSFDASQDIIVPVGNVFVNVLIGNTLSKLDGGHTFYTIALFRDKQYHTREVPVGELYV